jgi:hypothetical protein
VRDRRGQNEDGPAAIQPPRRSGHAFAARTQAEGLAAAPGAQTGRVAQCPLIVAIAAFRAQGRLSQLSAINRLERANCKL